MTNIAIFREITKFWRYTNQTFNKVYPGCIEWQGMRIAVNDGYITISPLDLPVSVQFEFISARHLFRKLNTVYVLRFELLRENLKQREYVNTKKSALQQMP